MTEDLSLEDQLLTDDSAETSDDLAWLEGETEKDYVERLNKETKRNFKSLADVAKTIVSADKRIAELGRQPQTSPQTTPVHTNDMEVYFFEMKPEAQKVEADLRTVAKATGKSLLQVWKDEQWLQEKAASISREEQRQKTDAKKVIAPSGGTNISSGYADMSDDEIMNLPPEEAGKAIKAKAGRL